MNKKLLIVLPAYNAENTLKRTIQDIPKNIYPGIEQQLLLVDDASTDHTVQLAKDLGIQVVVHQKNKGYGGNQKTCYKTALENGADIVLMLHPDYQYDPKFIPDLVKPIAEGRAEAVFGSRMMKGGALEGGMPTWKHNANILLTALENVLLKTYLTEFHSGFRAYSRKLLEAVPFELNSDDFVFDNEIIVQILELGLKIEEVPITTRYFEEASTIGFYPCVVYGFKILWTLLKYKLHSSGLIKQAQFQRRPSPPLTSSDQKNK